MRGDLSCVGNHKKRLSPSTTKLKEFTFEEYCTSKSTGLIYRCQNAILPMRRRSVEAELQKARLGDPERYHPFLRGTEAQDHSHLTRSTTTDAAEPRKSAEASSPFTALVTLRKVSTASGSVDLCAFVWCPVPTRTKTCMRPCCLYLSSSLLERQRE